MSRLNGDLAELLNPSETDGVRDAEDVLKDDELVDDNREKCIDASREVCSALARCTNSESSTIGRTVTELDGMEAWEKQNEDFSRRTLGRTFRVHRECVYPKLVEDVSQVR